MDDEIVFRRLFDKLDNFEDQIRQLCDRLSKIEANHENHLADLEKIRADKDKTVQRRDKNIYIVVALVGAIVSIISLIK
ncbi:MAG: hypothetical protein ACE5Q4_02755 [Nitrosopumilus sp.]